MKSESKRKVLVLGTGNAQRDLLKRLISDYYVYACSFKTEERATELVDEFELIDISNVERIKQYVFDNGIEVVYSIGSDIAMPTVASVSNSLGLKCFLTAEQANVCQNKVLFRKALEDCYGSVKYVELEARLDLNGLKFPVIVKPADSQGQRGVQRVDGFSGLAKAYKEALEHSRSQSVIAEEYIEGQEISVNAFVLQSEVVFALPSDRISWPHRGGGIIHKHILPCTVSNKGMESINKLVRETVRKLGLTNGPLYFQIKMQRDKAKLIEVAPRLDGCHMWHLIKHATGTDLLRMTIDLLVENETPNMLLNEKVVGNWVLEFFCQSPEETFNASKHDIHCNSVYSEFYYDPQTKISRMNGFKEKVGYQIYRENS